MSSVAVTNTFSSGTTAVASQVNTNFSDLTTYINDRNSGLSKWDSLAVANNAVIDGTLSVGGSTIGAGNNGWTSVASETWTYATANSFTISGDKTSVYSVGDKIKLTQSSTVKYFYIYAVSYSAPNTTISITGGIDYTFANSAVSENYYSKLSTPNGFPSYFKYTPTATGITGTTTVEGAFRLDQKLLSVMFNISGTSNSTNFSITAPLSCVSISGFSSYLHNPINYIVDNNVQLTAGRSYIYLNNIYFYPNPTASWTASNTKTVVGISQGFIN
ncbi:MAG TPA: hypothetical protein PLN86_16925 [Candidatus Hydrogenedentes bacterium]|nr:hypothetical protein [Candidatus Hydrogenedentota bacterium]